MTRNYYDWGAVVARLRRQPLLWECSFPDHPADLATGINQGRSDKMRAEDGRLEATVVNRYVVPGFAARGDIWVRWVPCTTNHEGDNNAEGD